MTNYKTRKNQKAAHGSETYVIVLRYDSMGCYTTLAMCEETKMSNTTVWSDIMLQWDVGDEAKLHLTKYKTTQWYLDQVGNDTKLLFSFPNDFESGLVVSTMNENAKRDSDFDNKLM